MGSWLDAPAFGWPDEDALMDMLKRIGRNRVWRRRGARSIAGMLAFLHKTCRLELDMHPDARAILESDEGVLAGYWHGRIPFMPLLWWNILKAVG
jgi:lysophospholipid acyltransferase (LPLAT)-like uncharacterized protein